MHILQNLQRKARSELNTVCVHLYDQLYLASILGGAGPYDDEVRVEYCDWYTVMSLWKLKLVVPPSSWESSDQWCGTLLRVAGKWVEVTSSGCPFCGQG